MRGAAIVPLVLTVAFIASSPIEASPCDSLHTAAWLIGNWQSRDGDTITMERWQKLGADTFEGSGVTTKAGKQVDAESLRLVKMAQGVFYLAKVAHNQLPIAFELTQCSAQRLVFENPAHDFPKKLEYELRDANSLSVRVSDGKEKGFTVLFQRGG